MCMCMYVNVLQYIYCELPYGCRHCYKRTCRATHLFATRAYTRRICAGQSEIVWAYLRFGCDARVARPRQH